MRKPRPRAVKSLAQGHTAGLGRNRQLKQQCVLPETRPPIPAHCPHQECPGLCEPRPHPTPGVHCGTGVPSPREQQDRLLLGGAGTGGQTGQAGGAWAPVGLARQTVLSWGWPGSLATGRELGPRGCHQVSPGTGVGGSRQGPSPSSPWGLPPHLHLPLPGGSTLPASACQSPCACHTAFREPLPR